MGLKSERFFVLHPPPTKSSGLLIQKREDVSSICFTSDGNGHFRKPLPYKGYPRALQNTYLACYIQSGYQTPLMGYQNPPPNYQIYHRVIKFHLPITKLRLHIIKIPISISQLFKYLIKSLNSTSALPKYLSELPSFTIPKFHQLTKIIQTTVKYRNIQEISTILLVQILRKTC